MLLFCGLVFFAWTYRSILGNHRWYLFDQYAEWYRKAEADFGGDFIRGLCFPYVCLSLDIAFNKQQEILINIRAMRDAYLLAFFLLVDAVYHSRRIHDVV